MREITEADIEFITELEQRSETNRYETEGTPSAEGIGKSCAWFIEKAEKLPDEGAVKWIISDKNNNKLGTVSVACNWEETSEWEMGYRLLREYWGRGYASEAVKAVIEYAFRNFRIHRLVAFVNAENTGSVALARRVGMIEEGRMREVRLVNGIRNDEFVFSLLKSDIFGR